MMAMHKTAFDIKSHIETEILQKYWTDVINGCEALLTCTKNRIQSLAAPSEKLR